MESYKPTRNTLDEVTVEVVSIATLVDALLESQSKVIVPFAYTEKSRGMYLIVPNVDGVVLL